MPVFVLTYLNDEDLDEKAKTAQPKRKYIGAVLKAHNRAGREIPDTVTVHHGKLPTMPDGIHFNAEGQITLGKMAADAVEEFYDPALRSAK
jgi:lysophospholipase L1-like esterase